jgi:broad-specificity NMP kinase
VQDWEKKCIKDTKKFKMKEDCIVLTNLCPYQIYNQKKGEVVKDLEKQKNSTKCLIWESNKIVSSLVSKLNNRFIKVLVLECFHKEQAS